MLACAGSTIRADGVDFSLKCLEGQQRQTPAENVALSPVGVYMVLGCLANGAQGATLAELQNALGEPSLDAVNARAKAVAEFCAKNPTFQTATSVWGPVQDSFANDLRDVFAAGCFPMPFTSAPMNAWVSRKTNGRIPFILPDMSLEKDMAIRLLNAAYFKDKWRAPFDVRKTLPAPFYVDAEKSVRISLMFRDGSYGYFEDDDLQAVRLYYENGLSMMVFLPKAEKDMEKFIALLRQKHARGDLLRFEGHDVELYLPRFKLEPSQIDLKKVLAQMGVEIAFERGRADFSKMGPSIEHVRDFFQKTVIEVDEEGTVAAAVESMVRTVAKKARVPGGPPLCVYDRRGAVRRDRS